MHRKVRLFLPVFFLIILTLACSLPTSGDEGGAIETKVAATLAAAEGEPSPTPESMASTPAPTPTTAPPTPSPTPLPRRFVYVLDGNVMLWTEGGTPTALTSTSDVEDAKISDDGQVVAFIRQVDDTHEELWAVNGDGSDLQVLVTAGDFDAMTTDPDFETTAVDQFDFAPGSHSVTYTTQPVFMGPGLLLNNDLRQVDTEAPTSSVLLSKGQGGRFHYSPNGSKIAVVSPTQIVLVNADGSGRVKALTFPTVLTYSEYQYYPPVEWLPDGSGLRVAIPPHESLADPTPPTKVWHISADGSTATELFNVVTTPFFVNAPALSPNAQKLAYLQSVGEDDTNRELHVANADGSDDVLYETGRLTFEAWSPSSNHFIYSEEGSNPQMGQIGPAPYPITGVSTIRNVRWVSDSQYLYLNRDGDAWELWLGNLGSPNSLIDSSSGNTIPYDFTP